MYDRQTLWVEIFLTKLSIVKLIEVFVIGQLDGRAERELQFPADVHSGRYTRLTCRS